MKRFLSILIAILFLYNTAGYLIAFKSIQYGIKKEIKKKIKSKLDDNELVLIKYPLHPDLKQKKLFHWKEKNEFVLNGNMYDVVRKYSIHDTIYYYCINDTREKKLFGNLDLQVSIYYYCINDTREKKLFGNLDLQVCQNMASNTVSRNLMKLFKLSVDQSYLFNFLTNNLHQFYKLTYYLYRTPGYLPVQKDVETPPPEVA